jgi:clan AA aspartic protease
MKGRVNERLEPIVTVTLLDAERRELEIAVIVDTGFGGFLTLPSETIKEAGFEWYSSSRCELGDGSLAVFDVYLGTVRADGEEREILIETAETTPLAGMQILAGKRLTIDAVFEGQVVIERVF